MRSNYKKCKRPPRVIAKRLFLGASEGIKGCDPPAGLGQSPCLVLGADHLTRFICLYIESCLFLDIQLRSTNFSK